MALKRYCSLAKYFKARYSTRIFGGKVKMVLLSSPWWADIGVLGFIIGGLGSFLGIVGIILAIVFWLKPRLPQNEITYRVYSDSPVVSVDEKMEGKVKVFYQDNGESHPIHKATLVNLEVWNSGKTPVEILNAVEVSEKDPKIPITFKFPGRKVISVTELKTSDEDIIREKNRIDYLTKPNPQSDSIGLPYSFLKPHQSISLSILLEGPKGDVNGKGTTTDGAELIPFKVKQKRTQRIQRTLISLVAGLLVVVSILVALITYLSTVSPTAYPSYLPGTGTIVLFDPLKDDSQGHAWTPPNYQYCFFQGGSLHVWVNGNDTIPVRFRVCLGNTPIFNNFAYQIKMTFIKGDCGGVVFRSHAPQLYYYYICQDGQFGFVRYMDNSDPSKNLILASGFTASINSGSGQSNLIAVAAQGSKIDLYVNQHLIGETNDTSYFAGTIGVLAKNLGTGSTEVSFANATVWAI